MSILLSIQKSRDLTVCDTLKACYLVNIKTRNETLLDGYDSFTLDPTNECGYSIRCDVNGVNELDFIKFKYNNTVKEEFGLPRYMFGDAGKGEYINAVDYLSTCGRKSLTVDGHVWSHKCFTKKFNINVKNPKGKRCNSIPDPSPVMTPMKVPVAAPATAPVVTPVIAPVTNLTSAPVVTSTIAPLAVPTSAPVDAPVSAPVSVPTSAPVGVSTTAPVSPPMMAPVDTPISAPVTPPTSACKAAISGFTLVNADLKQDVMPLGDFNLTKSRLNIRAEIAVCVPKVVDSVLLELDGKTRCERYEPYVVFGDEGITDVANNNARYFGNKIGKGDHMIMATPYSGSKCDGMAGATFIQAFSVL
jgi:hypothetical protein